MEGSARRMKDFERWRLELLTGAVVLMKGTSYLKGITPHLEATAASNNTKSRTRCIGVADQIVSMQERAELWLLVGNQKRSIVLR